MLEIITPSNEEVKKYNDGRETLEDNVLQERTINKLFKEMAPNNTNLEDIMLKCSVLNDFYSTNIFDVKPVARHIKELNIDERLKSWDPSLVNDIARVTMNWKERILYSFASKYCSHHNFKEYPIFDDYVAKVLLYFQKKDKFYESKFNARDLRDYAKFKDILLKFISFYKLEFNELDSRLKDLDRYLRQLGKNSFPRQYQKKKKSEKNESNQTNLTFQ